MDLFQLLEHVKELTDWAAALAKYLDSLTGDNLSPPSPPSLPEALKTAAPVEEK
jgi:hypothetical protein